MPTRTAEAEWRGSLSQGPRRCGSGLFELAIRLDVSAGDMHRFVAAYPSQGADLAYMLD